MKHLAMIVAIILSMDGTNAAEESQFKITAKRDNDKVEVTLEKDKAVVSIRSPAGISQAIIEPKHGKWPGTVVFQMHLKGLEKFKVADCVPPLGRLTHRIASRSPKIDHPAVFPVALAEQLILTFSRDGDRVLDPFCGSGSSLSAAKGLDRDFRGLDVSKRYVKIALGRLTEAT